MGFRQESLGMGLLCSALKPVVKRIKAGLYVYLQGREKGKLVTRYLGPLERIVNEWLVCREELSGEELYWGWWTGRDLNRDLSDANRALFQAELPAQPSSPWRVSNTWPTIT